MNAHTRLKPPPEGFEETFIRWGWRGVETAHGARTTCNKRWVSQFGPDLLARRQAYRKITGRIEGESMDRITHQIAEVRCTKDRLIITLADDREISTPLRWFPNLRHASDADRAGVRIGSDGISVEWPSLKERVSVKYVLALGASDLPLWGGQ